MCVWIIFLELFCLCSVNAFYCFVLKTRRRSFVENKQLLLLIIMCLLLLLSSSPEEWGKSNAHTYKCTETVWHFKRRSHWVGSGCLGGGEFLQVLVKCISVLLSFSFCSYCNFLWGQWPTVSVSVEEGTTHLISTKIIRNAEFRVFFFIQQ